MAVRKSTFGAAVLTGALLLAGCSSTGDDATPDESTEKVVVPDTGNYCSTRTIEAVAEAQVCLQRVGEQINVAASGLEVGSKLTVEGGSGNTLVEEVDSSDSFSFDVGGVIVEKSFSIRGTWVDGESLELTVDNP